MLGVAVLLSVLLGRLVYLQVINHEHYATLSQSNRVKVVPVAPTRGRIFDRNGVVLADNRTAFQLVITPEKTPDLDDTLRRLGEIMTITEDDRERFLKLAQGGRRFERIPLITRLGEDALDRFAVDRHRFPGVDIEPHPTRFYPLGRHAVHVVGYVGRISADDLEQLDQANYRGTSHIGKTGIERYYEAWLHGTVGREEVEENVHGRVLRSLNREPPVPGQDLYLTLDINLQIAAEQAMADWAGSAVALAPKTGEVLALVSNPGYDPNLFVNGIGHDDYNRLLNDPLRPLFNRALRGEYAPASTVKPFMALAALDNDVIAPDTMMYAGPYYQIPDVEHRYRDWKRGGHGWVDMYKAIAVSADVYFYDLAYKLGIDRINAFLGPFGFGEPTGIDLPGEQRGILPSRNWKRANRGESWYHGDTLITGIGQGFFLATPVQIAHATSVLANRGVRFQPRLLHAIRDPVTGETLIEPRQKLGPDIEITHKGHWREVINAMVRVVHGRDGTARRVGLGIKDFQIAGKTGTAQVYSLPQETVDVDDDDRPYKLRNHALFIAFAPADDPQIVVAVVAEHGSSGSGTAAPIARTILDAYFKETGNGAE